MTPRKEMKLNGGVIKFVSKEVLELFVNICVVLF